MLDNLSLASREALIDAAQARRHAATRRVIELLVESMHEVLGDKVDEKGLDEWRLALRLVSNQMHSAAEQDSDGKRAPK